MKKIRVLQILDQLNTGGAEKIVFSYYQNIDRTLFEWDFIVTESLDGTKGMLEAKIENLGGKIYHVPRKRENYIKHLSTVNEIIKKGKYDVIHSHLDELSAFYLLFGMFYGVKTRIGHSHLVKADRGKAIEILCVVLKPIMKVVATDWFACGIDAGKALWGEKAVTQGKVHIMTNAIDTEKFRFDEKIRQKHRKNLNIENKTVLGSVGRLSYQKNTEYIIQVFNEYYKRNSDSCLVLIGVGEDGMDIILNEMVECYDIKDNVFFLGARNDVNELMMAMDYFILPSRFEGLPLVLVEAQCTGLTCFVSDTVTNEIKINNNVYYLSLTKGAASWAKEINQVKNQFKRENGINIIKNAGYQIENEAHNLSDFYKKAVSFKCI